jgi:BNR/Asp-box repeat
MVSTFGLFTSYQVNVDASGNNIIGDAANECTISVDPTDGNKMTIGWRQFNDVTSNFRQGGWGYTTDSGVHWTFPGVLQDNVFRSDPVTQSDEIGNFFFLSLQSNVSQSFFCDDLWRSTNGGQSWVERSPDQGAGGGDKQWLTIDKTGGPGHGFQYQADDGINCDNNFFVEFQRSTDGGVTWQAPIDIPNEPIYGTLDVDANGNLFVGGWGGGTTFYCVRSSNAQFGNQTPTFDQVVPLNMGGGIGSGGINGVGLTGQCFLAIDHSGGPTNDNIYMLASVIPPGRSTTDVMFVRSTDGGQTFSAPVKINDDPVNPDKWHWFGTFAVAPNGRLDAVWYDTRNAANNTDSQLFYSFSTDAGVTWAPNVAVSQPFTPLEGYPNQPKIGDYITIVSDETGGNVAYSATFNFNPQRNQHEEDVYYVRVFPGGQQATPTPTPTPTVTPSATPSTTPTTTPSATPTATPSATPTATPTVSPTPRPTPTPRTIPTPRGRPTPRPRP